MDEAELQMSSLYIWDPPHSDLQTPDHQRVAVLHSVAQLRN